MKKRLNAVLRNGSLTPSVKPQPKIKCALTNSSLLSQALATTRLISRSLDRVVSRVFLGTLALLEKLTRLMPIWSFLSRQLHRPPLRIRWVLSVHFESGPILRLRVSRTPVTTAPIRWICRCPAGNVYILTLWSDPQLPLPSTFSCMSPTDCTFLLHKQTSTDEKPCQQQKASSSHSEKNTAWENTPTNPSARPSDESDREHYRGSTPEG